MCPYPILTILYKPFDLLAPKDFYIIWLSNLLIMIERHLMKVIPEKGRVH
jgi:hypothetical protein